MLDLWDVCSGFEDTVLFRSVKENGFENVESLLICSSSVTEISDHYIYIGLREDVDSLLAVWDGECFLNIAVAACNDDNGYIEASRLSIIASSLPLADLHNRLVRNIIQYHELRNELNQIEICDGSLKRLLGATASMIDFKASFYIMNPSFSLIESCVFDKQTDMITHRLENSGYLTDSQIDFLLESITEEKKTVHRISPIILADVTLGYLLSVLDADTQISEGHIKILLRYIAIHMSKINEFITPGSRSLKQLLSDILINTPNDADTIEKRLNCLPHRLDGCIRFVIASQISGDRPLWNLAEELKTIFPSGNITTFDKYVVVLLSVPDFQSRPKINEHALATILKNNESYAIISKAAYLVRGLRTVYLQSKEMLELLPTLDITGGKRFVSFEDIGEYYRVHLCASSVRERYGHNRLIYLAHPIITELIRHDNINGNNLLEVLFSYIENDCSILETAEATHFHRNTIVNKLNKIKELFSIDLDDNTLKRELLFSCQVLRYASRTNNPLEPVLFPNTWSPSIKHKPDKR